MVPTRRAFLAAAAATGLAGCLGAGAGGESTATATDTPARTDTPEATPTPTADGATVQVATHPEYGEILVDSEGLTLYLFEQDTEGAGSSTCSGGCAQAWPPLVVSGEPTAGEGVEAALSTFERESGETQVAAAGWPLYYYAGDEEPGDATGQGLNDVWWVLAPDGSAVTPSAESPTATDSSGSGGPTY